MAADAVDGTKLADDAVASEHIADGAVGTAALAADAVDGTKLADDAVASEHIADGAVLTAALAADAVDGTKLADDAVASEHIADDAVLAAAIATGAVTSDAIAASAVGTSEIADGTVANADLVNDGVTIGTTEINLGASSTTLAGLTSVPSADFTGDLTGDIYAANGTSLVLDAGTDGTDATFSGSVSGGITGDVTGNILADNGTTVVLNNGAAADGSDATFTGDVTGDLTGNADTATKLATARNFSVSGDAATAAPVSFDGSGNVDLAISLSADAVGSAEIANDAVGSTEIATSAVGSDEIADASVANGDLVNDGIMIGTTDASLGGTYTTLAGLTSVSSTGFTGDLTGDLTGEVKTATQPSITTMANLTTVGTIGTGTWQGTAVADTYVANDLTIDGGDIDNSSIDASAIGATTAAAADVTTLTVEDATIMNESRDQAGDVLTIYDDGVGNVMTVSSTTGVHISDLTLNDSFTLTGNMSASTYTTTAGDPVNDNELARKAYVDAQIAANVSAFEVFDYDATASTIENSDPGNLTYYLNGANLFYLHNDGVAADGANSNNGYTFTVYGSGMDQITTAALYLRGTSVDLVNNNNWASSGSAAATFELSYDDLLQLSGGSQTDGVMRCHLVLDGKNSGLTFKFHLDSTSSAATTASFN